MVNKTTFGVDTGQVFLNGIVKAFTASLVAQFNIIEHTKSTDDRTGVKNLMKLWGNQSVIQFPCPLLKLLTGVGIVLTGGRGGHISIDLTEPVEGIVESFVIPELRPYIIDHPVAHVGESQLFG